MLILFTIIIFVFFCIFLFIAMFLITIPITMCIISHCCYYCCYHHYYYCYYCYYYCYFSLLLFWLLFLLFIISVIICVFIVMYCYVLLCIVIVIVIDSVIHCHDCHVLMDSYCFLWLFLLLYVLSSFCWGGSMFDMDILASLSSIWVTFQGLEQRDYQTDRGLHSPDFFDQQKMCGIWTMKTVVETMARRWDFGSTVKLNIN